MASPPQQPVPFHIIDIYRTLKKASPQGEPVLREGDKKLEVFKTTGSKIAVVKKQMLMLRNRQAERQTITAVSTK